MSAPDAILEASKAFGLSLREDQYAMAREILVSRINELLDVHFDQLVTILYRLDIYENKLRLLLQQHKEKDAAAIIADLVIERQLQKIKSRAQYGKRDENIDENEKW